jgi:hypothetical protein
MSAKGRFISCFQCKEPVWLSEEREDVLRKNQNTFHCLWGHQQHFPAGPTEADKLRRERDRLKQEAARLEEEKRAAWATAHDQREQRLAAERRASAARGQVTRLKNRAAAGLCPCCNRSFVNLQRHMATKHKGFTVEEVQSEVGVTIQ